MEAQKACEDEVAAFLAEQGLAAAGDLNMAKLRIKHQGSVTESDLGDRKEEDDDSDGGSYGSYEDYDDYDDDGDDYLDDYSEDSYGYARNSDAGNEYEVDYREYDDY